MLLHGINYLDFARRSTDLLQSKYGVDRIFSRTCDVKKQKTSHDTEIFVKAFHVLDFIRTCNRPIVMSNERCSKRVQSQERGCRTHEGSDSNSKRYWKLHEDRYHSRQYRGRSAVLHHATYGARKVHQFSPTENQKERCEKKARHKNASIGDVVWHNTNLAAQRPGRVRQARHARSWATNL